MNVENSPGDASRVGADLRAARERLGWSLDQVAANLRIRYPYLLAIEEGRVSELPGNAYALGFVRTYAASLGLDPDEVARRFRAEAAGINRRTELQFPAPVPQRGVPAGAVVLLGVVIAVGAYIGWYRYSGAHRGAETVQDVPERLAPLAKPAEPSSSAPESRTAASDKPAGPASAGSEAAPPTPKAAPAQAVPTPTGPTPGDVAGNAGQPASPTSAAAASPPKAAPDTQTSAPVEAKAPAARSEAGQTGSSSPASSSPSGPAPAGQGTASATAAPASESGRIVLRATADSWVQVRAPHGPVLVNRILHAGDTWTVPVQEPGKPPLLLTTGNAGGLQLDVDGTTTPPLGGSGSVRHDIPLDPAMIAEGKMQGSGHGADTASPY